MSRRNDVSPDEAAALQRCEAKAALIEEIWRRWEMARQAAIRAEQMELSALGLLREVGVMFQEASGKENPGFEFWDLAVGHHRKDQAARSRQSEGQSALISFDGMKFAVSLARIYSQPIHTLDEARFARQKLFEVFDQVDAPKRTKPQKAREVNPWSRFVASASSLTTQLKKLGIEAVDQWEAEKLKGLVRETEAVAAARERAITIISTGGNRGNREGEEKLTGEERVEFERCLAVVRKGMGTFVEVGQALGVIRDRRLYRESRARFEDWCQAELGWSDRHVHRLCMHAEVVTGIANSQLSIADKNRPMGQFLVPATERQSRELARLPAEDRAQAWQDAIETIPAAGMTAAHVREVVTARLKAKNVPH